MSDTEATSVDRPDGIRSSLPKALNFPAVPACWYHAGSASAIATAPQRVDLGNKERYVVFHSGDAWATLDARCSHMGADLSRGRVMNGRLSCPFHGWEYDSAGRCQLIPAGTPIPAFACQASFPTLERGGHVFFFNRPVAEWDMPFFDVGESDLISAGSFALDVDSPWYCVGANGFDSQHFACAHDRRLVHEPVIDSPAPHARRLRATFEVVGSSVEDRVIRALAGHTLDMEVTSWGGALILVVARFRRTTSYGLVSLIPGEANQTHVQDVVWVRRCHLPVLGPLWDGCNARLRLAFVREFVSQDAERVQGVRLRMDRLIGADRILANYFRWLQMWVSEKPTQPPGGLS